MQYAFKFKFKLKTGLKLTSQILNKEEIKSLSMNIDLPHPILNRLTPYLHINTLEAQAGAKKVRAHLTEVRYPDYVNITKYTSVRKLTIYIDLDQIQFDHQRQGTTVKIDLAPLPPSVLDLTIDLYTIDVNCQSVEFINLPPQVINLIFRKVLPKSSEVESHNSNKVEIDQHHLAVAFDHEFEGQSYLPMMVIQTLPDSCQYLESYFSVAITSATLKTMKVNFAYIEQLPSGLEELTVMKLHSVNVQHVKPASKLRKLTIYQADINSFYVCSSSMEDLTVYNCRKDPLLGYGHLSSLLKSIPKTSIHFQL